MFTFENLQKTNESLTCSPFMQQHQNKWEDIHRNSDIFRYKINNLKERRAGAYLLQLNPDRGNNRRTPECINNISQPFDDNKFNFTKVSSKEILFSIFDEKLKDTHTVIVNVSPISKYHSLLCPSVNKKLPQIVTKDSLEVVLRVLFIADNCNLKIGFNSLCALASVNHLHYHLLVEQNILPVEKAEWKHIKGNLYILQDYPVPAFCFKVEQYNLREYATEIFKLIAYLLDKAIGHNILISSKVKGIGEVYIWPRRSTTGVKQFTAFNVAVCELSGWFPIYNEEAFQNLTANDLEVEIKKWMIPHFTELVDDIMNLY